MLAFATDLSPLVVALLACLGVVLISWGIFGGIDLERPRCRRCRRDARELAWEPDPRCPCGADLSRRGAVRLSRPQQPRVRRIGFVILIVAIGATLWSTTVRSTGKGWRGTLPDRVFAQAIAWGDTGEDALAALRQRIEEGIDRNHARVFLEGLISAAQREPWIATMDRSQFERLAEIAMPEGDFGRRFVETRVASAWVEKNSGNPRAYRFHSPALSGNQHFLMRIVEVTVDGQPVAFTDMAPNDVASWRSGFVLEAPPSNPDGEIRVRAEFTYLPVARRITSQDATISGSRDPTSWGIPFAQASIERVALQALPSGPAPPTPSIPAPPSSILNYLDESHRPRTLRSASILPLAGLVFGLGASLLVLGAALLARRFLVGRPTLAAPQCLACKSQLRGAGNVCPARCPECGANLTAPKSTRWIQTRPRALRLVVVGTVALTGSAAAIYWLVPTTNDLTIYWLASHLVFERDESAFVARQATEGATNRIRTSAQETLLSDAGMDVVAAARELIHWFGTHNGELSMQTPSATARATKRRIAAILMRAVELRPELRREATPVIDSLVREKNGPVELEIPRCVAIGEPVQPIVLGAESQLMFECRGEHQVVWNLPVATALAQPSIASSIDVTTEWSATLQPQFRRARLEPQLTIRGVLHRTVVVVPKYPMGTLVTDPIADPLEPARPVSLRIRELGARDCVTLSTPYSGLGLSLVGRWEIFFDDAMNEANAVILATSIDGVSWAALSPTPALLPREITVRFMPDPIHGDAQRYWCSSSVVRLVRVGIEPAPGFEVDGVEYVRAD